MIYRFYDFNNYEFKGHGYVEDNVVEFKYDYLSTNSTEATMYTLNGSIQPNTLKGKLVSVNLGRSNIFVGVCTSNYDGTGFKAVNLLKYLNTKIVAAEYNWNNVTVEDLVAQILTDKYLNNPDPLMNVSILNINTTSSTPGSLLITEDLNLTDIIEKVFTKYYIVVKVSHDYEAGTINIDIGVNPNDNINIMHNNSQIKSLEFSDFGSFTNKLTLYDSNDNSYINTYYLLTDGSRVTDPSLPGRIVPIKESIIYVNPLAEDYVEAEVVEDNLVDPVFNNEINFELRVGNNIYDDISIGQRVSIYSGLGMISSIVTSISYDSTGLYYKVTCGANRYTLTNLLNKIL